METHGSDPQGNLPLISVIVPIYNVEKYVRKCLESLQRQSFKQIEVICIDDGSTDSSGRIADEYLTEPGVWPRFRIIHHDNNRGLSAARNTGIDESRADWLMFVDSDDWVDIDFCRLPFATAIENNADMVIFGAYGVSEKGRIKNNTKRLDAPEGLIDEFEAYEYGRSTAWNKLYRRSLLSNTRYPVGRVYEDLATTHKLAHNATRIILLQEKLYYHRSRKNSIGHTSTRTNRRDGAIAAFERCHDLISYGFPEEKLKTAMCSSSIGVLANTKPEDGLRDRAKEILDSIEGIPKHINRKQKVALCAWKKDERLFYALFRITGRMKE